MKKLFQLLLSLILILMSFIFYNHYFNKKDLKKVDDNIENQSLIENENNLIKNLKYNVKFDNNSQYFITSELSELIYEDNVETVKMQNVTAKFTDENNTLLTIKSKEAIYNNNTYDTKFSQDITINYMQNLITSDDLYLNFTNNIVTIYNNVVYEGLQGKLKADNVVLDLVTKNIEIFMNDSSNKVSGISN